MAFSPRSTTVNLAVTGTAQDLALPSIPGESSTVRLSCIGSQTIFFNPFGVTATVNNGVAMTAQSHMNLDKGSLSSISVIAGTTGSTLYATVGIGNF